MSSVKIPSLGTFRISANIVFFLSSKQPVHAHCSLLYMISDITPINNKERLGYSEKKQQRCENYRIKRIRVTEHPLQIHLLFAVRAHLLLPDDAPSSYAELMEPGCGVKARHSSMRATVQTYTGSKCHDSGKGSFLLKCERLYL